MVLSRKKLGFGKREFRKFSKIPDSRRFETTLFSRTSHFYQFKLSTLCLGTEFQPETERSRPFLPVPKDFGEERFENFRNSHGFLNPLQQDFL